MNATTRADLDAIPIPFQDGYPVRACVVGEPGGPPRLAWCFDGGRDKQPFGPAFTNARDAARASRYLNERGT